MDRVKTLLLFLLLAFPLEASGWIEHGSELDIQGWFTIFLFFCVLVALVREVLPPDVTMLVGAGVLVISGVLQPVEFLQGFSHDIIFILAMLFVVAQALEQNGILTVLKKWMLPSSKVRWRQILQIMCPVSFSSAFLNNTPIVLMLTPIVRKWAHDQGESPSKYLIPLSYAAIFGGVWTIIGTSSNLVVDGLMREQNEAAGFGFFELGYMGIPISLLGWMYMTTVGHRLLPKRSDPALSLVDQTREFTSEFSIEEGSPLDGLSLRVASRKYFRGEFLIEIERGRALIDSPGPEELLRAGDRLVFAGEIKQIAELHAVEGMRSLADPHFRLDVDSPHFSEVVISITSSLIGKTLKRIDFRNTYGASVIAIFRQGRRVEGRIGNTTMQAGDTLMLLSTEPWHGGDYHTNDFYYIKHNEELSLHVPWRFWFVAGVMLGMVVAVLLGVPMFLAVLATALLLVVTRNVRVRDARKSIQWNVLVLIGSSFAFGRAMLETGVATYIAEAFLPIVGLGPHWLIAGIYLLTMVTTEMITNNAAALLIFPIAIQATNLAGFESVSAIKAVGVTVAIAASCSFATPIGYQTNTIVYGPGGYRFTDYTKVGSPMSLIVMGLCIVLVPYLWPLV